MKVFQSFKEARKFVHTLDLRSQKQWIEYSKSGMKPVDIPAYPPNVYHEKWKGWGDFLGTGNVANSTKIFSSYEDSKKFVKKLNLKSVSEFNQYVKSEKIPDNIPKAPYRNYREKWKGWGDFLGTGKISNVNREYLSFKKAKEHVIKLNLNSQKEWREYYKSSNRPFSIPSAPERVYKKEWIGYYDWLGKNITTKKNKSKKRKKQK